VGYGIGILQIRVEAYEEGFGPRAPARSLWSRTWCSPLFCSSWYGMYPFTPGKVPELAAPNPGSGTALAIGKTYPRSAAWTKRGRQASSGGAESLQEGAGSTGQKSSWPKGIGPRLSWQAHLTDCVLLLDNIHQGKSSIPFPQRVGFPLSPLNTMASRSATPKERVGPQPIYLSQPIYL